MTKFSEFLVRLAFCGGGVGNVFLTNHMQHTTLVQYATCLQRSRAAPKRKRNKKVTKGDRYLPTYLLILKKKIDSSLPSCLMCEFFYHA